MGCRLWGCTESGTTEATQLQQQQQQCINDMVLSQFILPSPFPTVSSHGGPGEKQISLSLPLIAATKSLQSCLTLCDPIDGSPPGSPIPGILQAGVLEWGAISFSNA